MRCLQQVDIEYKTLKAKLQDLFNVSEKLCELCRLLLSDFMNYFCIVFLQLEQQIVQAGGRIPQVDI